MSGTVMGFDLNTIAEIYLTRPMDLGNHRFVFTGYHIYFRDGSEWDYVMDDREIAETIRRTRWP